MHLIEFGACGQGYRISTRPNAGARPIKASKDAGMIIKEIGTHTSYVGNNSKLPVMVIMTQYKTKPLKIVTYLSDNENLRNEVVKSSKTSKENSLHLNLLH